MIGVALYSAELWYIERDDFNDNPPGVANVVAADAIGAAEGLAIGIIGELAGGGADFSSEDIGGILVTAGISAVLNSATGGMGYAAKIWKAI